MKMAGDIGGGSESVWFTFSLGVWGLQVKRILLEEQSILILKFPVFSWVIIYLSPSSETTVLTGTLPFPDSLTSRLLEAFTGWNARELPFLQALCLPTQGSIFVSLICVKAGACNILCTSHICAVQSRSLQPQCFFLSIKLSCANKGYSSFIYMT